ncbi:MAG TPA: hypothetical protein DCE41_18585 [Cytophagales bacterium]|nr:hypothetical protein [Cytophagales bacterium]
MWNFCGNVPQLKAMPRMQPEEKKLEVEECQQLLQLIVDGQATPEQTIAFQEHICSCKKCDEKFKLDSAIKEAIKKTCGCHQAPQELVSTIQGALQNLR